MDLTNLKEELIFSNYRELCRFIDEPIKTGTAKMAQLVDWNMYFNWDRIQNTKKYLITHINSVKQDRVETYHTLQKKMLSDILLKLCYSETIYISRKNLMKDCGFINDSYNTHSIKPSIVLKYNLSKKDQIYYMKEYDNIFASRVSRILTYELKKMNNNGFIDFESIYLVQTKDDNQERESTEEEACLLKTITDKYMFKYKLNIMSDLKIPDNKDNFYYSRKKVLLEKGFIQARKVIRLKYIGDIELNPKHYKLLNKNDVNIEIVKGLLNKLDNKVEEKNITDRCDNIRYYDIMREIILSLNALDIDYFNNSKNK